MRSFRSKPVGWRGESHRHYLAAKGIKTVPKKYFGVFVYRKSLDGKHRGDETDNERRVAYGMELIPGGDLHDRMSEAGQKKYADDLLKRDDGDIEEIRFTEDATDLLISRWKDGRWRSSPAEDQMKSEEEEFFSQKDVERARKRVEDRAFLDAAMLDAGMDPELFNESEDSYFVKKKTVPEISSGVQREVQEMTKDFVSGERSDTYNETRDAAIGLLRDEDVPLEVRQRWSDKFIDSAQIREDGLIDEDVLDDFIREARTFK